MSESHTPDVNVVEDNQQLIAAQDEKGAIPLAAPTPLTTKAEPAKEPELKNSTLLQELRGFVKLLDTRDANEIQEYIEEAEAELNAIQDRMNENSPVDEETRQELIKHHNALVRKRLELTTVKPTPPSAPKAPEVPEAQAGDFADVVGLNLDRSTHTSAERKKNLAVIEATIMDLATKIVDNDEANEQITVLSNLRNEIEAEIAELTTIEDEMRDELTTKYGSVDENMLQEMARREYNSRLKQAEEDNDDTLPLPRTQPPVAGTPEPETVATPDTNEDQEQEEQPDTPAEETEQTTEDEEETEDKETTKSARLKKGLNAWKTWIGSWLKLPRPRLGVGDWVKETYREAKPREMARIARRDVTEQTKDKTRKLGESLRIVERPVDPNQPREIPRHLESIIEAMGLSTVINDQVEGTDALRFSRQNPEDPKADKLGVQLVDRWIEHLKESLGENTQLEETTPITEPEVEPESKNDEILYNFLNTPNEQRTDTTKRKEPPIDPNPNLDPLDRKAITPNVKTLYPSGPIPTEAIEEHGMDVKEWVDLNIETTANRLAGKSPDDIRRELVAFLSPEWRNQK